MLLAAGPPDADLLSPPRVVSQSQGAPERLESGPALQRTLSAGESHRYDLALASGEFVSVVVEQRGIDVGIQARDEGGQVIAIVSDEPGTMGDEQVDLVTRASAVVTVVVAAVPGVVGSGDYAIRVEGRHAATDGDRASQEVRALRTKALVARGAGRQRARVEG